MFNLKFILLIILFVPNLSFGLCVKVDRANLRNGPGTKYEKTWEVFKFMPLLEIERKGGWIKVKDLDKDEHWVFKKLVSKKLLCAVVRVKKANLRTGPGTHHKMDTTYGSVDKYASFKFLSAKGKWANIEDEKGRKYWIARSLIWVN